MRCTFYSTLALTALVAQQTQAIAIAEEATLLAQAKNEAWLDTRDTDLDFYPQLEAEVESDVEGKSSSSSSSSSSFRVPDF